MSQKRDGSFNHYDHHPSKQQKMYSSQNPDLNARKGPSAHNRNGYSGRPQQGPNLDQKFKNKDNPVLSHIERLPDPANCEPCKLAAAEMQTGMIALLGKLEAEEMTPNGDNDVLHHASELRRLLSARAEKTGVSQAKVKALDEKWPVNQKYCSIPKYVTQRVEEAKDLPPLPPITEPHLEEAVFTHATAYKHLKSNGVENPDLLTYERLELLGDAYIEIFASRLIWDRLSHVDVPQQSAFREKLVKNETLSVFSIAYAFPDRLKHGGHIVDGNKAWTKVTADVFEAYIAGVVLSDPNNGFKTAEEWMTKLWAPQMLQFKLGIIENPKAKDDVQRLIKIKDTVLDYRQERNMIETDGQQSYSVGLYFTGHGYVNERLGGGEGRNLVQARVYAAMDALKRNGEVMKTAAKKKQEMIKIREEQDPEGERRRHKGAKATGEATIETVEEATAKKSDPTAVHDITPAKDGLSVPESKTEKKESKATGDTSSAKNGLSWLEKVELETKESLRATSDKDGSSWLEREKRKKEKKERKEKKRSG